MLPGWMSPDPPEPPVCKCGLALENGACPDCDHPDRIAFNAWAASVIKRNEARATDDRYCPDPPEPPEPEEPTDEEMERANCPHSLYHEWGFCLGCGEPNELRKLQAEAWLEPNSDDLPF